MVVDLCLFQFFFAMDLTVVHPIVILLIQDTRSFDESSSGAFDNNDDGE